MRTFEDDLLETTDARKAGRKLGLEIVEGLAELRKLEQAARQKRSGLRELYPEAPRKPKREITRLRDLYGGDDDGSAA